MQATTNATTNAATDASQFEILYAAAVQFATMLVRKYGCDPATDANGIVADCWINQQKIDDETISRRFPNVSRSWKRRRAVEIHSATGEIFESPRDSVTVESAILEILPDDMQEAARSFANGGTFGASDSHTYKLIDPLFDKLSDDAGLPTHTKSETGVMRRAKSRKVHGWKPIPADQINLD